MIGSAMRKATTAASRDESVQSSSRMMNATTGVARIVEIRGASIASAHDEAADAAARSTPATAAP